MHLGSKDVRDCIDSESVKTKAGRLAVFWQAMSQSNETETQIGEFLNLDKLLITVVSGSVADERAFSGLEFVKTARRNRLSGEHLEACV